MAEHTPTPWVWDGACQLRDADGHGFQSVSRMGSHPTDANMEHIVHCVNMHDELVEALYNLHVLYGHRPSDNVEEAAHDIASDVLAKAKGDNK